MLHRSPDVPPIVSAEWLLERLGDVTLVDCRWYLGDTDGRAEYLKGHLPGAVWANLDQDLAAPSSVDGGRHPLPSPTAFADAMSRLGIPPEGTVVAYDQGPGGFAARLVWMLRVTGHDAALLDGGLAAWPGPVEAGEVRRTPSKFEPRPWPREWLADLVEVADRSASRQGVIVDSRAAERYSGEVELIDARAGHVPGAVNLPFAGNLAEDGTFLSRDDLARRFAEVGVGPDADVVVYCGSGVTACQNLLAMESVGIPARLYPGSWSQWAGRPDLPTATDSPAR